MVSLMRSLLFALGFENIITAQDGEEAYKVFKNHNPDIVITDWVMRPKNGLYLIEQIRRSEDSPNPYVPIIMMTGYSSLAHVELARDSGMTEFLVKPFTVKDLSLRIRQVIERPRKFVDTEEFFGPDRRRRKQGVEDDDKKRHDDVRDDVESTTSTSILDKLRSETQKIAKDDQDD